MQVLFSAGPLSFGLGKEERRAFSLCFNTLPRITWPAAGDLFSLNTTKKVNSRFLAVLTHLGSRSRSWGEVAP